MKKIKRQTFYYKDELNDDFATTVKTTNPLPKTYKYVNKSIIFRVISFVLYYLIVKPLAYIYVKIKFHHRIIGKKKLKGIPGGFIIYGNHTTLVGDAFIPNILTYKQRNYIITGEQASSLHAILPLMKALGNIPLGQTRSQSLHMAKCVKTRLSEGACITVYPEARVWPYYTGIRPFGDESFMLAASNRAPVIAMTTCFAKKRIGKKPKIITVIEGPFYPKEDMCAKDNAKYLHGLVYEAMTKSANTYSTYSYHTYIKQSSEELAQKENADEKMLTH